MTVGQQTTSDVFMPGRRSAAGGGQEPRELINVRIHLCCCCGGRGGGRGWKEEEWGVNGEDCSRFMYSLYLHLEIHSGIDLCARSTGFIASPTLAFVDSDTGNANRRKESHKSLTEKMLPNSRGQKVICCPFADPSDPCNPVLPSFSSVTPPSIPVGRF